jgi:hypothetical protein
MTPQIYYTFLLTSFSPGKVSLYSTNFIFSLQPHLIHYLTLPLLKEDLISLSVRVKPSITTSLSFTNWCNVLNPVAGGGNER